MKNKRSNPSIAKTNRFLSELDNWFLIVISKSHKKNKNKTCFYLMLVNSSNKQLTLKFKLNILELSKPTLLINNIKIMLNYLYIDKIHNSKYI